MIIHASKVMLNPTYLFITKFSQVFVLETEDTSISSKCLAAYKVTAFCDRGIRLYNSVNKKYIITRTKYNIYYILRVGFIPVYNFLNATSVIFLSAVLFD
jgi:hypothetical protein